MKPIQVIMRIRAHIQHIKMFWQGVSSTDRANITTVVNLQLWTSAKVVGVSVVDVWQTWQLVNFIMNQPSKHYFCLK